MSAKGGYRGSSLAFLEKIEAEVGDGLELNTGWGTVHGTLVPRYQYDDESHIVVKLSSGYNIGLDVSKLEGGRVVSKGEVPTFRAPPAGRASPDLPRVALLSTGGTIASRVDYRTGAVHPVVSASELNSLVPELFEIAGVEPEILMSVLSENLQPKDWTAIATRVARSVEDGVAGVVVTQGTDTLGYTAAALSFALKGVPVPVVITGAQRSSDRPSSDAFLNLTASVSIASTAGFSGVYVAMHDDSSDGLVALHRGTRVRKDHTSERGAFESVGVQPAALWRRDGLVDVDPSLPKRGQKGFESKPGFSADAALVKFYPGMSVSFLEGAVGAETKALVIEGTGMGHVSEPLVAFLKKFVASGGLVFMTSQCLKGRVDLNVYETGRDLKAAGVVPLEDMLPETALVKAMWSLANGKNAAEVTRLMASVIAGETTARSLG